MSIFQVPPPTRYDLRFSIAGIPVRVHPLFWVIAVLLGSSSSLLNILIWVAAVFVSILVHELGHALAMRHYGQSSQIILHFAGGLTVPTSTAWGSGWAAVALTQNQEILVSLAGPVAGFSFAGLVLAAASVMGGSIVITTVFGILPFPMAFLPGLGDTVNSLIMTLLWVNIFWGLINLVPVHPLDGGNVARFILLKVDPWNGIRNSLWLSTIAGAIVALIGLFIFKSVYVAFLFGLLAFQSFQAANGQQGSGY